MVSSVLHRRYPSIFSCICPASHCAQFTPEEYTECIVLVHLYTGKLLNGWIQLTTTHLYLPSQLCKVYLPIQSSIGEHTLYITVFIVTPFSHSSGKVCLFKALSELFIADDNHLISRNLLNRVCEGAQFEQLRNVCEKGWSWLVGVVTRTLTQLWRWCTKCRC